MVPHSPSMPLPTIIFQGEDSVFRAKTKGSRNPVSFPRPVGGRGIIASGDFTHVMRLGSAENGSPESICYNRSQALTSIEKVEYEREAS